MLVHLIYIHGFQGTDTTFQSFPNDLQECLSSHIPSHLNVKFQSSLYPTYKSVKPISYATKNFLEWLQTQPPGPVIVIGHSMGGLLAADAATDPSNTYIHGSKHRRIVGVVAFDTPFLGMHPHVIVSGIASLLPKDDDRKGEKSEREMNPSPDVKIVSEGVTDDWEGFKKNLSTQPQPNSLSSSSTLSPSYGSSSASPFPSEYPFGGSPSSSRPRSPPPLVDRAISFISKTSDSPFVRWMQKHADDPFSAGKRWIAERFQFGSCMFDPSGLKDRYSKLVEWDGDLWVNYWTQTLPRPGKESLEEQKEQTTDNNIALLENGISGLDVNSSSHSEPLDRELTADELKVENKRQKKAEKEREKLLKQQKKLKEKSKAKPGHHFVVLPTGLGQVLGGGEKWEKVVIGGVEDEVAAHCGLFIRGQNLDYDGLVVRVAAKVFGWCDKL